MNDGEKNWLKIDPDVYCILKQVSEARGKPQTHYVEQGLKLMFSIDRLPQFSIFFIPVFYMMTGIILFIFSILLADQIAGPLFVLNLAVAMFIISFSILLFYGMRRLWKVKNGT